jgi:hypothetical protein
MHGSHSSAAPTALQERRAALWQALDQVYRQIARTEKRLLRVDARQARLTRVRRDSR